MSDLKQCMGKTGCQEWKPLDEFTTDKRRLDGKKSQCRSCCRKYKVAWRAKNPDKAEKHREESRKWQRDNPERFKERCKQWRDNNPDRLKQYHLLSNYGITIEDRDKLLYNHNYSCAICGVGVEESKLCVDHNHTTGKVRGILCNKHNIALGSFDDNPNLLEKAAEYLRKYDNE